MDNGMRYMMFTKQYHMTAGLEQLSSNMRYGGRLENADSTLLVNRPQSQAANSFIQKHFGLTTIVPHLFLNVHTGYMLRHQRRVQSNTKLQRLVQ